MVFAFVGTASADVFRVNVANPDFGNSSGIRYYPLDQDNSVKMEDLVYEGDYTYRLLAFHHGSS